MSLPDSSIMTFQQALSLLCNFLQKRPSGCKVSFDGKETGRTDNILVRDILEPLANSRQEAVDMAGESDYDEPLTEALWAKKSKDDQSNDTYKQPKTSAYSMADAMGTFATLAFALEGPEGVAFSAVFGIMETLVGHWENTPNNPTHLSYDEVTNTQKNAFTMVEEDVVSKLEQQDLKNAISHIKGEIARVQDCMNALFRKAETTTVANDVDLSHPVGQSRQYVLSELGRVFALIDSGEWTDILTSTKTLSVELEHDVRFAHATYACFLYSFHVIISAVQLYINLYPLPDEAYVAGWDGKGNQRDYLLRHKPYDFTVAFKASAKHADMKKGLPKTGKEALDILVNELLDPDSLHMKRYDDDVVIWNIIYNRLSILELNVDADCVRNGLLFLQADQPNKQDLFIGKGVFDGVKKTYGKNQCVLTDPYLLTEDVLNGFRNFHTEANFSCFTVQAHYKQDRGTKHVTFPIKEDGSEAGEGGYTDVFWCPGDDGGVKQYTLAFDDPKPGFLLDNLLQLEGVRNTVGWMGMLLANYINAYQVNLNMETFSNTLFEAAGKKQECYALLDKVKGLEKLFN